MTARAGRRRRPAHARRPAAAVLAGAAAVVAALAGWGTLDVRRAAPPAHPTLLDGDGWNALSLREREALVQGFLIGAAAAQAAPASPGGAGPRAGAAEVADAIAGLRESASLRFSFAPSMLARRLDEYYWWRNQRAVPVAAALVEVHDRLRAESF
ncbi:MAG TPA: hypothetical protein VIC56_08185 [Gemmatimonadota bacterium]